jgi:hypothetical protein
MLSSFSLVHLLNKILVNEDIDMRDSWIALTKVVYDINRMLLEVLAIKVPDKM